MSSFLVFLTICASLASVISLYILIFASFEKKEKKPQIPYHFIKRDSRYIKAKPFENKSGEEKQGNNSRVVSLLSTVIIGQIVTLYFLFVFLNKDTIIRPILRMNALILLIASFICSILTILNAWLKKKMVISFRLLFQGYSLLMSMILIRLTIRKGVTIKAAVSAAGIIPDIIISMYFSSVIVALAMMLIDALYRKNEHVDYDFNIYFRIVVLVGMIVGLGMIFSM